MTVSARDLRQRAAEVLRAVRHGETVTITYRGRVVGVIHPAGGSEERAFSPVGFGMWRRDLRARDVQARIDRLRGDRYRR